MKAGSYGFCCVTILIFLILGAVVGYVSFVGSKAGSRCTRRVKHTRMSAAVVTTQAIGEAVGLPLC